MDKRKAFYKVTEIMARQSRGTYWISFVQTYFNPISIMATSAYAKVLIPQIPTIPLMIFTAIGMLSIEIIKYFIGTYDEKKGFWKMQNEYQQKKEHLHPFNNELVGTLKEICNKLEIKHHFNDLQ